MKLQVDQNLKLDNTPRAPSKSCMVYRDPIWVQKTYFPQSHPAQIGRRGAQQQTDWSWKKTQQQFSQFSFLGQVTLFAKNLDFM